MHRASVVAASFRRLLHPARRAPAPLGIALALATQACAPAFSFRDPIAVSGFPADAYVGSNMLVVNQTRLALPDGWHFKRRKNEDDKSVFFWITDTGSNSAAGVFRYAHFDFPVSPARVTEFFATKTMNNFENKEAHKTELDGKEAYIVLGKKGDGSQRASALIHDGPNSISEVTLNADPGYFGQNPRTAYTIFNSYRLMPRGLSERRIKGSFSFRCDDGTMHWFDDFTGSWVSRGFSVAGKLGGDFVAVGIRQVTTTRFQDFLGLRHV